ncbi:MAG: GNAT family N-acetyltransferase [Clostridia bacterium]|nr:GNAT family N-acetyltransferase [Clostridia bacterium]
MDILMSIEITEICLDHIHLIEHLWVKNRKNNSEKSLFFSSLFETFTFEIRKALLIEKVALGNEIKIYIVKDNEKDCIFGFCVISYCKTSQYGEFEMIYIDKEYRNKGYGSILIANGLRSFNENQISDVGVCVAFGNTKALDFYRKFGFYEFTINMKRNIDGVIL